MNCTEACRCLPLLLYGELSPRQEEDLDEHLEGCAECRTELGRVRLWQGAVDAAEPEVPHVLLSECRRRLRGEIRSVAEMAPRSAWWRDIASGWSPILRPAGALALVALGYFGARFFPPEGAVFAPSAALSTDSVALRVRDLELGDAGRMHMVVEEVRERSMECDLENARARQLLLQAARESNDPGLRVQLVSLLQDSPKSEDVRKVLLYALRHDTNAGVRLKAIDGLRGAAGDPEIRSALTQVLLADNNPGVRTQAVDLLLQKREPALVGVLQEVMQQESNSYVRMRCQKVLSEMNASVETF